MKKIFISAFLVITLFTLITEKDVFAEQVQENNIDHNAYILDDDLEKAETIKWGEVICIKNGDTVELHATSSKENKLGTSKQKPTSFLSSAKNIIVKSDIVLPEDSSSLFRSLPNVTTFEINGHFDTSNVTTFDHAFSDMRNLKSLDLKGFNTENVYSFGAMFTNMNSLQSLNISDFDTSNATYLGYMFQNVSTLQSLDVSHFDTSKATNMDVLFSGMESLNSLDISNFDTNNVTSMKRMFEGTSKLSELTIGPNTKNINLATTSLARPYSENSKATGNWIESHGRITYSPFQNVFLGVFDKTNTVYIPEIQTPIELDMNINFDKESSTVKVNDELITTITIKAKNQLTQDTAEDIIVDLSELTFGNAGELPGIVTVEEYDTEDILLNSVEKQTESICIDNITKDKYIKIQVKQHLWNNNVVEEENYKVSLNYTNEIGKQSVERKGFFKVNSGVLGFSFVPKELEFESVPINKMLGNNLINRSESNWGLSIVDYRGTNNDNSSNESVRTNWELAVTAAPFHDEINTEIPTGVLGLVYENDGKINNITATQEVIIVSHNVEGEKPKQNFKTNIQWSDGEGIKLVARNNPKLKADTEYSTSINFELRQAP